MLTCLIAIVVDPELFIEDPNFLKFLDLDPTLKAPVIIYIFNNLFLIFSDIRINISCTSTKSSFTRIIILAL
jgi:hypothetical protein